MTDPTLEAARPYMAALADELTKAGAIRSPEWAEAFATVPRHAFVPEWYEQEANDRGIAVWRRRQAYTTDTGLAAVYRDTTLVTALDPDTVKQVDESAWTGVPTSSATRPGGLRSVEHSTSGRRSRPHGNGGARSTDPHKISSDMSASLTAACPCGTDPMAAGGISPPPASKPPRMAHT